MTSVSRKEGFRYGFYVFAYWLVLLVFSAALVAAGGYIVEMQNLGDVGLNEDTALAVLGGFVGLLGVLVFGSGQVGLAYKLVADGVSVGSGAGNRGASGSVTDSEGTPVGTDTPTAADEAATAASAGAASAGTTTAGPEASERVSRARQEDGSEPQPEREREPQPQPEPEPQPEREREPQPQPEPEPQPEREPAREPSRQPAEVGGTSPDQEGAAAESDDPAPRPRERGVQSRDGHESRDGGRDQPDEAVDGRPRARKASETPDDGRPNGDQPEQPAGDRDGTDEEPEPGERESPADVASESEIAEKLGFEESDGPGASGAGGPDERATEDVESAETVIDPDAGQTDAPAGTEANDAGAEDDEVTAESDDEVTAESDDAGDASALDWGGSETTGNASGPDTEGADETNGADTSGTDATDPEDPTTGTGSLADALAGDSGADENGDDEADGTVDGNGDDEADGTVDGSGSDEAESPRWTTGQDHEGGPGQGDGQ